MIFCYLHILVISPIVIREASASKLMEIDSETSTLTLDRSNPAEWVRRRTIKLSGIKGTIKQTNKQKQTHKTGDKTLRGSRSC